MSNNQEQRHYYSAYGIDQCGSKYKLLIIAKSIEDAIEITRLSGIRPHKVEMKEQASSDYRGIIRFDRSKYSDKIAL